MRVEERFQTADELIDALKGKFVTPSLKRSRLLIQQGKLSEAVQVYNKCLVDEPNNGEAAVELALIQTYINDTEAEVAAQLLRQGDHPLAQRFALIGKRQAGAMLGQLLRDAPGQ